MFGYKGDGTPHRRTSPSLRGWVLAQAKQSPAKGASCFDGLDVPTET